MRGHPSCLPSALTPLAFPELLQSLGGSRRRASSNETRAPAKFSGTSVNNAVATSVHNPFRATIGFAETTSLKPFSIDSFRAPACDRSPERPASPTQPSDASPTASGVIAFSFTRSFARKRHHESPLSWMAFAVLNTASTGPWTSTWWSGLRTSSMDSTMRSFDEVARCAQLRSGNGRSWRRDSDDPTRTRPKDRSRNCFAGSFDRVMKSYFDPMNTKPIQGR
jgi:hypothetical protein